MKRLVYLSPLVLALGLIACQKRDAAPTAPASPGTTSPATTSPGSMSTTPDTSASAPSMGGSAPAMPGTGASQ